jgi:siroheme decarboxylase
MTKSPPATPAIDPIDARLLDVLQTPLPLVARPFEAVGRALGLSEQQVLERVTNLKSKQRVIRQISAIFDSKALGYQSCLVAAQVDPEQIDTAAEVVNAHPGVSHNYRRNDAYNLWYTLAVPPDSQLGLDRTIEILHHQSGARVTRKMPALKMYKIGVKFSLSADDDASAPATTQSPSSSAAPTILSETERVIVRVLQQDLPIVEQPFDLWAEQAAVTVPQLLAAAEKMRSQGIMRRFSAVLRHQQAGFGANAMGVWAVPEAQQDGFGAIAASVSAVSHCYVRPSYRDWPYTLYTMVHGKTSEQCEAVLRDLSQRTGIAHYKAVYSTHEYKKVRVRYFTDEARRWEEQTIASAGIQPNGPLQVRKQT